MNFLIYLFSFKSSLYYKCCFVLSQVIKLFMLLATGRLRSDYFVTSGRFRIENKFGKFEIQEPSDMHSILSHTFEADITSYFSLYDKNGIFLDIGANIGKYSMYISNQGYQTYSFEPSPLTYAFLEQNKILNSNRASLHLIPYGIDTTDNKSNLYFPNNNLGVASHNNVWDKHNSSHIECSFMTMSHAINEYAIDVSRIQLIKIDVEGGEYNVILSLQDHFATMTSCRIIIEISHHYDLIDAILVQRGFMQVYKGQARNFVYEKK